MMLDWRQFDGTFLIFSLPRSSLRRRCFFFFRRLNAFENTNRDMHIYFPLFRIFFRFRVYMLHTLSRYGFTFKKRETKEINGVF